MKNKYRKRVLRSERTDSLIAGSSADRLSGLESLLASCTGKTVLDIGCHDGAIAEAFADHGAVRIDGCDLSTHSLDKARTRFENRSVESTFHCCDLSAGEKALNRLDLLPRYDLVLYLGTHHHLVKQMSTRQYRKFAQAIAQYTRTMLAVRAPRAHHQTLTDIFTTSGGLTAEGDIIAQNKSSKDGQEVGPVRFFAVT